MYELTVEEICAWGSWGRVLFLCYESVCRKGQKASHQLIIEEPEMTISAGYSGSRC